jgi:antiviral helicase SKI2
MLSATIPNYEEFASWIGKIKNTKVYIENTNKRVVPLQHFIYVDNDHIYKVKDKEETINNLELNEAFKYLKSRTQKPKNRKNDEIKKEKKNNEN